MLIKVNEPPARRGAELVGRNAQRAYGRVEDDRPTEGTT